MKSFDTILKGCKNGEFCCEGQIYLYNTFNILCKRDGQISPTNDKYDGDLICEIMTIRELLIDCPFCVKNTKNRIKKLEKILK
jgi:hypothetical protein